MSIDVEDYFQVSAFAPHIRREDWDSLPCRVERNVDVILGLLDEAHAKATFFTLGWIAERYPQVVRRIVDGGHELASHGYGHQQICPDGQGAGYPLYSRALARWAGLSGYRPSAAGRLPQRE